MPATAAPAPAATATIVARRPANSVPSQSSQPALDMEVSNAPHGRALVHDHRGHGGRGEGDETVARERLAGVEGEREATARSVQRSARRGLARPRADDRREDVERRGSLEVGSRERATRGS